MFMLTLLIFFCLISITNELLELEIKMLYGVDRKYRYKYCMELLSYVNNLNMLTMRIFVVFI
jgi:hypothetical protein